MIEEGETLAKSLLEHLPGSSDDNIIGRSTSTTTTLVVFSTLVAVSGSYVFGTAVGYSSPAETGIVYELGLTTSEYSVFGSILTVGAIISAVVSGRLADILGRKGAMAVSEIFCVIGWLAIVFAKSAYVLDIGRFLMGCGIGLVSYVAPVYVSEIAPKNVRGAYMTINQLMIGLGKAFTFLIGSLVNWRVLAIIGIIPCVLQLVGLFFIPESPRWLMKMGRVKEFESSLQHLRGKDADISNEAAEIKEYTEYLHKIQEEGILNMFQMKYARSIIIGVGLMAFQQFGGLNAFVFYSSTIFESAGFSSTTGTILAAVVQIVMTTLGVLFVDTCGRRPILLISAGGTLLGCILTGLSFFFQDMHFVKTCVPVLVLLGVLVYLGSFEFGMGGIPWMIISEIFPINIKGSAGSLVNLVCWFGSGAVAYTFYLMFDWSSAGTFFIYAAISGAGVIFIAKLVPETKGRTLEEIQASMTGVA